MAVDMLVSTEVSTQGTGDRTMVHVELSSSRTRVGSLLPDRALRTIERIVRSDDWVCPYAVAHLAVAFGPDALAVTSRELAERLARAVEWGVTPGDVVGADRARPRHRGRPDDPTCRPTGSPGDMSHRRAPDRLPSTTVTVDRPLVVPASGVGVPVDSEDLRPGQRTGRWATGHLRHRTVVRFPFGRSFSYGSRYDDAGASGSGRTATGTVLVVDPIADRRAMPSLAASATHSLILRLGLRAEVRSLAADDGPILEIGGSAIDSVVLVVSGQHTSEETGRAAWETSSWCLPARIAHTYRAAGVEVVAVSSGAGAGALAGCVEAGATVLLDPQQLPAALLSLRSSPPASDPPVAFDGTPVSDPRVDSLVRLTTSERRVLFFLTQGRSAQEIADELSVSLTTVRSHIRSILRKTGVRSQLAAVAIANGQGCASDVRPFHGPAGQMPVTSSGGRAADGDGQGSRG